MNMNTVCVPQNCAGVTISFNRGVSSPFDLPMTKFPACDPIIISTPIPMTVIALDANTENPKVLGVVTIDAGFSRIIFDVAVHSIQGILYIMQSADAPSDFDIRVTLWRESDFNGPNR